MTKGNAFGTVQVLLFNRQLFIGHLGNISEVKKATNLDEFIIFDTIDKYSFIMSYESVIKQLDSYGMLLLTRLSNITLSPYTIQETFDILNCISLEQAKDDLMIDPTKRKLVSLMNEKRLWASVEFAAGVVTAIAETGSDYVFSINPKYYDKQIYIDKKFVEFQLNKYKKDDYTGKIYIKTKAVYDGIEAHKERKCNENLASIMSLLTYNRKYYKSKMFEYPKDTVEYNAYDFMQKLYKSATGYFIDSVDRINKVLDSNNNNNESPTSSTLKKEAKDLAKKVDKENTKRATPTPTSPFEKSIRWLKVIMVQEEVYICYDNLGTPKLVGGFSHDSNNVYLESNDAKLLIDIPADKFVNQIEDFIGSNKDKLILFRIQPKNEEEPKETLEHRLWDKFINPLSADAMDKRTKEIIKESSDDKHTVTTFDECLKWINEYLKSKTIFYHDTNKFTITPIAYDSYLKDKCIMFIDNNNHQIVFGSQSIIKQINTYINDCSCNLVLCVEKDDPDLKSVFVAHNKYMVGFTLSQLLLYNSNNRLKVFKDNKEICKKNFVIITKVIEDCIYIKIVDNTREFYIKEFSSNGNCYSCISFKDGYMILDISNWKKTFEVL